MDSTPQLFVLFGEFRQTGIDGIELWVDGYYARDGGAKY